MRRRLAIVGVIALIIGCGGEAPPSRDSMVVVSQPIAGGGSTYTAVRGITPEFRAWADSVRRAAAAPRPVAAPGVWPWLTITYFGARAQVTAWGTDGSEVQDTTAPEDVSCDGFAEQHVGDEDGVGCLDQDRSLQFERIAPGEAMIQFVPADTGSIFFEVEAYSGGAEHNRRWHGLEFRTTPGRVQRFRIRLPAILSRDPLVVEPVSGVVDTVPPRVDPDSVRG